MEHINRLLIAIIGSRLEPIFDPGPSADSLFFRLQSAVVLTDEVADLIGHRQQPYPLFLGEYFKLARKRRNVDQEVLGQNLRFGAVVAKFLRVLLQIVDAMKRHSAFDSPQKRAGFIMCEIDSGGGSQYREDRV